AVPSARRPSTSCGWPSSSVGGSPPPSNRMPKDWPSRSVPWWPNMSSVLGLSVRISRSGLPNATMASLEVRKIDIRARAVRSASFMLERWRHDTAKAAPKAGAALLDAAGTGSGRLRASAAKRETLREVRAMAIRVGINGFGRIGRNILRAALHDKELDFVAVN